MGPKQFTALFILLALLPAFALAARPKAGDGTAGMVDGIWIAPIGIPEPEFGIYETYRMYDDDSPTGPRNPDLTYTRNSEGGYFTNYIDNSGACSNSINPWDNANPGTVDNPRCEIPRNLPEGSVVEVHGGPYTEQNYSDGSIAFSGNGTESRPIFIRGGGNDKPRFGKKANAFYDGASYMIVENLNFNSFQFLAPYPLTAGDQDLHHIVLRNSVVEDGGGVAVNSWTTNNVHDIVIYNNVIQNNGDYLALNDTSPGADVPGITIARSKRVWAIDNYCYRNSNACVFLNVGSGMQNDNTIIQFVYAGRNKGVQNREANFWSKEASFVVFSENEASGSIEVRNADNRGNGGMGFQYGPDNVWFLFNEVYDETVGIVVQGDSKTSVGQRNYFIGNTIYDIHHGPELDYFADSSWAGAGIRMQGGVNRYIIGNTIYDADAGINGYGVIYNNIVSNINEANDRGNHSFFESDSFYVRNNLFYQEGTEARFRHYNTRYNLRDFDSNFSSVKNNYELNPLFAGEQNHNFELESDSPAINRGLDFINEPTNGLIALRDTYSDPDEIAFYDFIINDLEERVLNDGTWDIGANQFQGSICVDMATLLNYISRWRQGSITMPSIISKLAAWKSGEGC